MKMRTKMLAAALPVMMAPAPLLAQSTVAVPVVQITGTQLDVVARGETTRVPDIATISAGVVTQGVDAATAMRENAQRISRVIAALKGAGVADRDIQTANINLSPQYRYEDGKSPVITGYQASNNVSVRFRDIARSGAILDTLVREGANQINGPDLSIDKPETAQDEARVAAMKAARARAELYASAAGLKVKRILSISESGDISPPRPMPVMMMAARGSDMAESKVVAGEQSVGIVLSVKFELE